MPVPYPLIRALLPLCLGIWAGDCYPLTAEHLLLWGSLTGALLLLTIAYLIEHHRLRRSLRLGVTTYCDLPLLSLAFVFAGAALATCHRPVTPPSSISHKRTATGCYLFELITPPKERPRTYVCQARLLAQKTSSDSTMRRALESTYLLYIPKEEVNPAAWQAGQFLVARTTLRPFTQLPDSNHFDYPTYARRRGWSGTAYLTPKSWIFHEPPQDGKATSWPQRILHSIYSLRQQLIDTFQSSTLDDESLGLITALTLGDKALLPAETKVTFSQTGVSHLLALSGLHVGILYALLLLPTFALRRRIGWLRSLNLLLVLCLLWGFALLTGLSASVVRSVTMYSLLTLGLLLGSPTISINTLATAALLLLIVRPYWLFDVGFQLSCTGVASILYLTPPLQQLYHTRSRWKRALWNFITVSTTAQVGTAPLVASYFGTFSPYFLLANAWSIPLITLLLYLSIAWVIGYGVTAACSLPLLPLLDPLLPTLFGGLTHLLSSGLHFIQRLPLSCINVPRPDAAECLMLYTILLLLPQCRGRLLYPIIRFILLLIWMLTLYHYFIL